MPSPLVSTLLIAAGIAFSVLVGFLLYVWLRYSPIIARIFEESPVFKPPKAEPLTGGEEVRFPTADGLSLAGTYLKTPAATRAGVVVFCPEFLGNRGSAALYAAFLPGLGFDMFSFDFRNHGDSDAEPTYTGLQWASNRETRDLRAALAYLRKRPDADPAGVGLFGISRGGSAAITVAARDAHVWGVVTDGAFGTSTTMLSYMRKWAEIYVTNERFTKLLPDWFFNIASWSARKRTEHRLRRKFANVERSIARIAPRPLFMIHGDKDNYISPNIARALFGLARDPKELWVVPKAKHNRGREVDPVGYRERVSSFFRRYAPRRPPTSPSATPDDQEVAMARGNTDSPKIGD